eukprot:gene9184-biopygen7677
MGIPLIFLGPASPAQPSPAGLAGLAWPGLWRGTQAVAPKAPQLGYREAAPKAPQLGYREAAPKAPRLAPKAPPSAPKCPQNTRKCPGHAQCVTGAGQVSRLLSIKALKSTGRLKNAQRGAASARKIQKQTCHQGKCGTRKEVLTVALPDDGHGPSVCGQPTGGGCRTGEDWIVSVGTHGQVRARTGNVRGTLESWEVVYAIRWCHAHSLEWSIQVCPAAEGKMAARREP